MASVTVIIPPAPGRLGKLCRARLVTAADVTVGDVALTGTPLPDGVSAIFTGAAVFTMTEDPTYGAYGYEIREVATQDAPGFDTSTTPIFNGGALGTPALYGYLVAGNWYAGINAASVVQVNGAPVVPTTGNGARAVTVVVTDGTSPLGNAAVRFAQGTLSYYWTTAANGSALFSLDDGTYTLSITKGGYQYAATTEVISGSVTLTRAMTATVVATASDPGQTVATLTTYDATGTVQPGVVIEYRVDAGTGTVGRSYPGTVSTATANGLGVLTVTLARGVAYKFRRVGTNGSGEWVSHTAANASTDTLPEILGRPQN